MYDKCKLGKPVGLHGLYKYIPGLQGLKYVDFTVDSIVADLQQIL